MVIRQNDITKVRESIGKQLGNRVMVKLNKGRHKVDIEEGVIMEAYPNIFLIQLNMQEGEEAPRTLSFSYKDVLTRDVQMKLC